jgi:putative heme-binding domain-containing protein
MRFVFAWIIFYVGASVGMARAEVHMLVPGFSVVELPVKISNINNLRFGPDGALTALAYDGKVHVLRDSNGDGVEDTDTLFWDKSTLSVPVGMCWSTNGLFVSSHGKVSLLKDTDGDGKADEEEIIASGWPPTDVGSGGVDATAVTLDGAGNLYFGLLVADYSNPYRVKDGVSHYDLNSQRGTIQKYNLATKRLETIATGIRVPYSLAFNRAGDLFNTDQEGETWCPNGNPLDELNHIIPGRNYGFPPRDEKWLPNLVSEAPVVAFGPQHQSSCGLVFNEPNARQKLFGPAWWEGDAFVCGESRGKIWRVKLTKTPNGYVGRQNLIARLDMLTMDAAISPRGDLYVCCHSGNPDWGTGPQGIGRIYKISYTAPEAPQPVRAWPANQMEVRVEFDKPIDVSITNHLAEMRIEFGEFVAAADRFEKLKPPYKAVTYQEATPRGNLRALSAAVSGDGRTVILKTEPHPQAVTYALTLPGVRARGGQSGEATVDLAYDLNGEEARSWAPAKRPLPRMPETETEIAGGDFERGRELFFGEKMKCATCHRIRGEGATVGPDLSNLAHRDAAAVLRDIQDPSAAINPDYVAYNVSARDGDDLTGFVRAQSAETLRIIGADGKERLIEQKNIASLKPSAVSLMPMGLLNEVADKDVRSLLTFLVSAPPMRSRDETILAKEFSSWPQNIVLVASKQDHGPGQHDYPAWQTNWMKKLGAREGLKLSSAWEWPSPEQWKSADVMVFYFWNHDWSDARYAELDEFQKRGGGLVLLHAACIADKEPEKLAERIGLAAQPGRTGYLHTPFTLKFANTNHAMALKAIELPMLDEPYWPMIGDTNRVEVLATANIEGAERPLIWTYQRGRGKVFVSVPAHYTWTWEVPAIEALFWRAIGWVAARKN